MSKTSLDFNKYELSIIAFILLVIYTMGAMIDIMEVDAAQYASISRQMLETGSFFQIKNGVKDYLDKPPFLFWISAVSIKIFGVTSWAYKLPSILLSLLGIFSTFSLGKLLYNLKTGFVSALILASCQAFFLMNQDVRTDNILCTSVIFSIWQIFAFLKNKKNIHLVLGFVGIGIAFLTKGPIGLIIPVFAFSSYFIYKKEWNMFFKWEWLIGLFIVIILLVPFCIGLYNQYGSDGLYFYFWNQSFGRITGDNVWKNDTTILFFTHVLLWAFLPWSFLFVIAILQRITAIFKKQISTIPFEALCWGGFVLSFISLSLSKYKLPHYIFVTFPFASIICASWLVQFQSEKFNKIFKFLSIGQFIISILLFIGGGLILYLVPTDHVFFWSFLLGLFLIFSIKYFLSSDYLRKIIFPSLFSILFVNIVMNSHFYPYLFSFQGSSIAARLFDTNHKTDEKLYTLYISGHNLDYYGRTITESYVYQTKDNAWIFTNQTGLDSLISRNINYDRKFEFSSYPAQFLSLNFLNPKKRPQSLKTNYLIHLNSSLEKTTH